MTENVQNVQVAAGAYVGYAPAGTAAPALPVDVTVDPAAPWQDVGYVTDDGITNTRSRESENFGAWQSPTPIAVLVTAITDTLAFAIREWNQRSFEFVYGGEGVQDAGPPATGSWEPTKLAIPTSALLLQWDWLGYPSQLWVPRGTITGDTETILARTAPADLAVELVSTPNGDEPAWRFLTAHPAFAVEAPALLAAPGAAPDFGATGTDEEGAA
jgi:hypothetical protein